MSLSLKTKSIAMIFCTSFAVNCCHASNWNRYWQDRGVQAYDYVHSGQLSPGTVKGIDETVSRVQPWTKPIRDCSAAALLGAARAGVPGAATMCAAGAAGITPGQIVSPKQAY